VSIADKIARPSQSPQITRARHRSQLQKALEYMSNFSLNDDLVLAAEDLRMTMRAISNITGKITVDEILGEIFSNFCIGK
jgi:tRNA modification GTPase